MKTIPHLTDNKSLLRFLEEKGVLITANRRMARSTLEWYARAQIEKDLKAWETPSILPLSAWMEKCAQNLLCLGGLVAENGPVKTGGLLLSQHQERIVWEEIIADSAYKDRLFSVSGPALRASAAWKLANEWDIVLKPGPLWESGDPAAFMDWAGTFDRLCTEKNWIDQARLPLVLGRSFSKGLLDVPEAVCLYGFDEFPPAHARLFEILSDCGTRVFVYTPPPLSARAVRCGFADDSSCLYAAARWAADAVESNPNTRAGVVVLDLQLRRNEVLRIFDEVCHPDGVCLFSENRRRAFNISYGTPLSDVPVVRAALMILSLASDRFTVSDWSNLLRSPFLAAAETERYGRARMDEFIRGRGQYVMPVSRFLSLVKQMDDLCPAPAFVSCIETFQDKIVRLPRRLLLSGWAGMFSEIIRIFGWPGEKPVDSHEYQAVSAFKDVLCQMGETDLVSPSGRLFEEALFRLKSMLSSSIFQPEQEDAPIQIMGFLEAAGQDFDRLWISGLDHEHWPAPCKPEPFLPVSLQRKKNLPHSSPERELVYARRITGRLLSSAPEVHVGYAVSDGENRLFPSPLIARLPEVSTQNACRPEIPEYHAVLMDSALVDTLSDPKGPPVSGFMVEGGTGLVKDQAACPFKAFAHYRLKARELESPGPGLSPAERGSLVHAVLEKVWRELRDQATLLGLAEERLEKLVDTAVSRVLAEKLWEWPGRLSARFRQIEAERLSALVMECLALERVRPPFSVIETEKKMDIEINGLRIKVIVDRIDRLEDGRIVIIDYKTGQPEIGAWMETRISEPQLPLYASAMNEPLAGVFFLQVRKGKCRYIGLCADDGVMPGGHVVNRDAKKPLHAKNFPEKALDSLASLVEAWKDSLGELSSEILEGYAAVAPADPERDCRYCDLNPLCRFER